MVYEVKKLYADREDVTLTSYVHSDSVEMLNGKKRGAVLICPGGGYLCCSDREAEPVALRFASMGYHTFVLRYSTYNEGKSGFPDVSNGLVVNEKSIYPNPMRDIAKAMLYIRDNAEEWLVDTDKIAICGFSAGAHNCAMYSVYWNDPVLTEYFNVSQEQLKPAAAILGYGPSDYILQKDLALKYQNPMFKRLDELMYIAYTGVMEPDDEMRDKISPALHVSEITPPTFLWATAGDHIVSIQHTLNMANALSQKNVPLEVHIFERGEHGLSLANQTTANIADHIEPDVAKWVELAEQWLLKRFQLF
jgi:Esterase/lipase